MVLVVELALEPVHDVVDLGEPRALEGFARLERAVAAATNQYDRTRRVVRSGKFSYSSALACACRKSCACRGSRSLIGAPLYAVSG